MLPASGTRTPGSVKIQERCICASPFSAGGLVLGRLAIFSLRTRSRIIMASSSLESLRCIELNLCQREDVDVNRPDGDRVVAAFQRIQHRFLARRLGRVHMRAIMRELAEPA